MKLSTITQLNRLNQNFYQTIGESFDATRQSFWPGWTNELHVYLAEHFLSQRSPLQPIKVLDIGCGNGRFGQFLSEDFPDHIWDYTGIDNSQLLLEKAAQKLSSLSNLTSHLSNRDIVENLNTIPTDSFDLIVAFGLLHHLPGNQLRQSFFNAVAPRLLHEGHLVVSCWQFLNDPKLSQRLVDPSKIGISPADLEEGDYILDWRAGETANRYCHHYTDQELATLTHNWQLQHTFFADGHSGQLNRYLLLTPTSIESKP